MSKTIKLSLISVALLSSLNAEQTVKLEPLTITSTAIKTDELRSTDAVEIYTQEDIEKTHSKDIYEFLGKQTSVIAMPTFGNPFAQKIDMHGYGIGDGYQNIVITLNGRKMGLAMSFSAGVYDDANLNIEECIQQADECLT